MSEKITIVKKSDRLIDYYKKLDKINISSLIAYPILDSNNDLISDPFLLYDGQIDTFEINEGEDSSDIIFTIVSHWADFQKISGKC